ncbi:MAG TPA: S9 family peptidase [Bacteroidales bacterium]|nr:S9 family peptidase [Bacteroidales bacterium]
MKNKSSRLHFLVWFLLVKVSLTALSADPSITLSQIWRDRYFAPATIRLGRSLSDGLHYSIVENNTDINIYSYESGALQRTVFSTRGRISDEHGSPLRIDAHFFSPDEKKLLIGVDREAIYRRSYTAEYYVYDIAGDYLRPLAAGTRQTLPVFSPGGDKVSFVSNNNLFIANLVDTSKIQVTHDGKRNHIINGTTDWVYEEEFAITLGHYWSPDGKFLAFFRFDESHVREFTMFFYEGSPYPREHRFKYPKAGEQNSHVTIHIYNVESGKNLQVNTGQEKDQYIPRIQWTHTPGVLSVTRLNRRQNHKEILLADAFTGNTNLLYFEKNRYFVEITDDLIFLKDGKHFVLSSEKSGYRHLYLYDLTGRQVNAITSGEWDIQRFFGIDERRRLVYFTSHEESPLTNHIYRARLNGSGKTRLSNDQGFHIPSFSAGFEFYINQFSTANTPPVFSIHRSDGSLIKVLENNELLTRKADEHGFVDREFFKFTTGEGVTLNAWMMKPADFDSTRQHPVLMYVYGGPDSQTVIDRWDTSNGPWFQLLTQMGFIVVSVDNRGTGARGEEFRKMTYLQLGKYETIDQIEAAKYLGTLPFIDPGRIGIFGWSYGGFISSLCLALGADFFAAAVAVAPVTHWKFYDTIYTERFMRLPDENPEGYEFNAPLNHAGKIRGAYLLVHGTADDNVHYQNTLEMISALVKENVPFDLAIYPNHNHGIARGNARLHLFEHITRFLQNHLIEN